MKFSANSGCRDRAMLVLGSNTAKQAALTALLDPSTHFRPPLTHTSHHRPTLVHLSRFRVSPILTHSHFMRSSSRFSSRSSSRCRRFLFPEQSQAFQAFLMARGHISASFHLQRSNKGPLESSRQGAHDRAIISDFMKYDPGRVFRPTM